MITQNLVSSKKLIAELFADYAIEGTDWIARSYRHIARAMEIMQIDGYFERKYAIKNVIDYMCPLPCENKNLIAVLAQQGTNLCRIDIKNNFYIGKQFADLNIHTHYQATLNMGALNLNVNDIAVGLLYFAIPKDEEGYPLIVDNAFVLDALPFYLIMKLGYSGYKHPVISRQEAEEKWELYRVRARNNVNFMSIEEMESYTVMNTNPYFVYTPDPNYGITGDTSEDLSEIFLRQLHKESDDLTVIQNNYTTNLTQQLVSQGLKTQTITDNIILNDAYNITSTTEIVSVIVYDPSTQRTYNPQLTLAPNKLSGSFTMVFSITNAEITIIKK